MSLTDILGAAGTVAGVAAAPLTGGASMAIPALIGTGVGVGQLASGVIKKRQANNMQVPLEDARYRMLFNDLEAKRKQLATGTDVTTQMGSDRLERQMATVGKNIVSRSGGDIGAAMSGLAMAQSQAGDAFNQILSENQRQQMFYQQQAENMAKEMANRRMNIQMWQKLQKMRESAENTKAGFGNLMGGITRLASGSGTGTATPTAKQSTTGTGGGLTTDLGVMDTTDFRMSPPTPMTPIYPNNTPETLTERPSMEQLLKMATSSAIQ